MTYRYFSRLGLLALVAAAACAENPAEPPDSLADGPDATINPVPEPWTSCYPIDVISERTVSPVSGDTTQTVYTGFEGCGPGFPGQFDMWLYGIEIQDLTNEPPYGNARLELDNRASWVLNAPSGGTVAIQKSHAPPIGFVEFEPHVTEASFYFSVRWPAQAYWNNQAVGSDSVEVRAIGDGGIIWDRVTLHANSPDYPAPYQVWDTVTLSGPHNSIKFLEIRGQMAIDDLKIVSGPRPQAKCTSVVRGQTTLCRVDPQDKTVVEWVFGNAPGLPAVSGPTSGNAWDGTAVASGLVEVTLSDGTNQQFVSTQLVVQDRPSLWTQMWDYNADGPDFVPDLPIDNDFDPPLVGGNCDRQTLCQVAQRRVTPDPAAFPGMGSTTIQVNDGGPNDGYWWVSSIDFNMYREGNLNPSFKPSSTRRHPVPGAKKKCWDALGFPNGNNVVASFYEYNDKCVNGQSYASDMLAGAWFHEGFGDTISGGVGHELLAQEEAGRPANDVWLAVDTLVTATEAAMLDLIEDIVGDDIGGRISDYASDTIPPFPGGNWEGSFWYYSQAAQVWRLSVTQNF